MKTLLTTLNSKYIHLNLAVRLLYGYNKDIDGLEWHEFTIKESSESIVEYCKDFDVVAFSCYIWNITQTLHAIKLLKAENPAIKILLGGPEVSYEWENLVSSDTIDFIVVGEGELPFRSFLLNYPDVSSIPNLVSKSDGKLNFVPDAKIIDLNEYSNFNPYIHDDKTQLAHKVCYVETSRGCPYKCEFCLASLDNKVRYLPMEDIKANLMYLMQHGRVIKFLDRTFNVKKNFSIEVFQFILDHHKPDNIFQFEITADIVHTDIVDFIQQNVPVGLFRFEIGIQTVNQKANLEVSRRQNFEKTSKIIKLLSDKVEMHLDLIVGLPFDYWDDIKYSFEEVFKLYPSELQLGFLKFLKGTPMRVKTEQHGYVYDPDPPYQIIRSNYLSESELYDITLVEEALEIYWNKKRAVRLLKYVDKEFSIFDFLLGLGRMFSEISNFHKHTLTDVYDILHNYISQSFPENKLLFELLAFDFAMQYKVKPKNKFLEEMETKEKNALIQNNGLQHTKYRYGVYETSFDWNEFEKNGEILPLKSTAIIQYDGKEKPQLEMTDIKV